MESNTIWVLREVNKPPLSFYNETNRRQRFLRGPWPALGRRSRAENPISLGQSFEFERLMFKRVFGNSGQILGASSSVSAALPRWARRWRSMATAILAANCAAADA
jgi:hypothetical protein